jgi:hypothetical protein
LIAASRDGGMGMNLAMTGIDHQPLKIRFVNQALEQGLPDATIAPTAEASMDVFPVAISWRQVAPRSAGSHNPKHCVDELAIIFGNATPLFGLTR